MARRPDSIAGFSNGKARQIAEMMPFDNVLGLMIPFSRTLYAFARRVLSSESPRLIAPVLVLPSVYALLRESGRDGKDADAGNEDAGVTVLDSRLYSEDISVVALVLVLLPGCGELSVIELVYACESALR